jgi:hypothetical protein
MVSLQTAVSFFTFFENNERGYVVIRPLREKVEAAKAAIRGKVADDEYETAVAQAQQRALDDLLLTWLG